MKKTKERMITEERIENYAIYLKERERSTATVEKYQRDIRKLKEFLKGKEVSQVKVIEWKKELLRKYKITSVNSMLAAVNSFFLYLDWKECKVHLMKVQKENFIKPEKELSKKEYEKLIQTAHREGKMRIALIIQTIGSTGIRISELPFITVEAIVEGRTQIYLKGKIRTIFLPDYLRTILALYVKEKGIKKGAVFVSPKGIPLNRTNIWREMKKLCEEAEIEPTKVFPHNLRHLFARTHYSEYHDIIRLADILGHSSMETTRIYMMESGTTHLWQINNLKLLCENTLTTT